MGAIAMKIAIALFGTRVSPRFDCASSFQVVDVAGGVVVKRQVVPAGHWQPPERAARLADLGVHVVICGGIDRFAAQQLSFRGVQVYAWVSGEAQDALQCWLAGNLRSYAMLGPGGRCCGRWRFGRGGPGRRGQHGGRDQW